MRPNLLSFTTSNINSIYNNSSSSSRRTSTGSNGSSHCTIKPNGCNKDDNYCKDNSNVTLRSKLIKYFRKRHSLYATLVIPNNIDTIRIDEGFHQQLYEQQKQRRRSTPAKRLSLSSHITDTLIRDSDKSLKRADRIQRLPIELSCLILSYCDKHTITQATRVSTYWHSVCTDNYLWHQLYLNHFGTIYNPHSSNTPPDISTLQDSNTIDYQRLYKIKMELVRRWKCDTKTHFNGFHPTPSMPSQYLSYFEQQQPYNDDYRIQNVVGHKDSIYCVQFDGRKIVTGSRDKTIKLWHYNNPSHCYKTLYGHDASVLCLQYNDSVLVTGSSDHTVLVWSMETFEILYRLSGHLSGVLDVCFENDNDGHNRADSDDKHEFLTIASCSKDTTIKIWKGQRLAQTLHGHKGPVNAIQFKGNRLVSASGDTMIKLWDMTTGKCIRDFTGHTHGLACVQFDGKKIVSGGNDNKIKIWDADTGDCLFTCTGHVGLVRSLFFDHEKIVSGSYDQSIRIWDIKTGECIRTFKKCHTSWVFDVMFDETKIISTSQDQKIVIIDFAHDLDTTHIVKA